MKSIISALLIATLVAAPVMFTRTVRADDTTKDEDRIVNAGQVVKEIMDIPDNIPQSLIDKADCAFVFQAGGQATDFVLLVMNEQGANAILASKVKIGADASAAIGPVGRAAAA